MTASVGAPRIAGIEYPLGHPLGEVGDAEGQRRVLQAALQVLASVTTPGSIVNLPFVWQKPAQKLEKSTQEESPITKLCKRKPWLFLKLLSGDIPAMPVGDESSG